MLMPILAYALQDFSERIVKSITMSVVQLHARTTQPAATIESMTIPATAIRAGLVITAQKTMPNAHQILVKMVAFAMIE
jgi:hypothetical protein